MNWDDLKIFLVVAREGSARAAANKLSVHHSTITRRIEAFESAQKTRFFDRLPCGYVLTLAGEELLQVVSRVEDEIHSIERYILGKDVQLSGNIRVTMPDALVTHLLMPDIVQFMDMYPDVNVEVLISYSVLNLTKREADVAIRITENPPEHLIGRKVCRYHCANYGTPHYLATHDIEAGVGHWIGWDCANVKPDWIRRSDFPQLPVRGYFNNPLAQVAAAKAELGIARIPCFLGDMEPALQRVPPGESHPCHDIWILTHKDLVSTVRIQTFMDAMAEAFRQKRELLEGCQTLY
ncbi:MAG: LysR family transcriptional regulator [Cyanobacteria bacterium P01_F01_bin.13]